jgi:hypothetical protein
MNTIGNNVFSLNFLVWKFGDFFQKFCKNLLEFSEKIQKNQNKKKKRKKAGQQSAKFHPPKNASLK